MSLVFFGRFLNVFSCCAFTFCAKFIILTINCFLALIFKRELQNQECQEADSVTLQCELSKPRVPVVWRKGTQVIHSGEKYHIKQVGPVFELKIPDVKPEDAGVYSCDCGLIKTSSTITVNGRNDISFELWLNVWYYIQNSPLLWPEVIVDQSSFLITLMALFLKKMLDWWP